MDSSIFDHKPFEEMTTQELEVYLQRLQAWETPAERRAASAVVIEEGVSDPTPAFAIS